MKRKLISRREALGVIGKTGTALGAGTCFFVSLNTTPLEGLGLNPQTAVPAQPRPARTPAVAPVQEKVVLSGSGSTLTARLQGPPGRHVAVVYTTTRTGKNYKAITNDRGYIGENGTAALDVSVAGLPNGRVFVRVVTSATAEFAKDLRGTETFEITVANGAVAGFVGVRERPLDGTAGAVRTAAVAACVGKKPVR